MNDLLDLYRPYNSTWEVVQLAAMPSGHTPWGVLRALLREAVARRDAIRDLSVSAEDARRARFWARLTLRPAKARAYALREDDARRRALMLADQMAALVQRAGQVRRLLPDKITPHIEAQLDRDEGLEALRTGQAQPHVIARLDPPSVAMLGQAAFDGRWEDLLWSSPPKITEPRQLLEGAWLS